MMFYRVNDHMVSCAIGENEIMQMGYQLVDLYKDKELVGKFMREVYDKAKEIGFKIADHIQTVQVAVTQNHQFILNFIEADPEEQINDTIQNLLDAAEAVDFIGKDRLEEIMSMTGDEKADAFQECMIEIRNEFYPDVPQQEQEETHVEEEENCHAEEEEPLPAQIESSNEHKTAVFFLCFEELAKVQEFSRKVNYDAPGRLYKDSKEQYVMLVDIGALDKEKQRGFLFIAEGYTTKIHKGTQMLSYMEEHAEILVKNNPIAIMREI